MSETLKAYGGGVPTCSCFTLPHAADCPLAPFFSEEEKIQLDSEVYADPPKPFHLRCPHCKAMFSQFEHAIGYEYTPTEGQTDQHDLPIVCPRCKWTDKQSLPALVGFDPNEDVQDVPFAIVCPECGAEWDRSDGIMDVWLERAVVIGVEQLRFEGSLFQKGQVYSEYTEMSLFCPDCGHAAGEEG
jgi:hypothetical protein